MVAKTETISLDRFARAVAEGLCRWQDCQGLPIMHTQWGAGVIRTIEEQSASSWIFTIEFAQSVGPKRFDQKGLANPQFFSALLVPPAVYAAIVSGEQREAEEQARKRRSAQARREGRIAGAPVQPRAANSEAAQAAQREAASAAATARIRRLLDQYGITCLYYMAHVENVPSILHHGILSHNRAQRFKHQDFSLDWMQDQRDSRDVSRGRTVHDYANLYFATHTPTQYVITHPNKWGHPVLDQARLVFIEVDPIKAFLAPGMVFSDGNAGRYLTQFYTNPDELAKLQWAIIRKRKAQTKDDKRFKCAEVLVPDRVPPEWFTRIVVYNSAGAEALRRALQLYNYKNAAAVAIMCRFECDSTLYD